jgi:hypothetical protein
MPRLSILSDLPGVNKGNAFYFVQPCAAGVPGMNAWGGMRRSLLAVGPEGECSHLSHA